MENKKEFGKYISEKRKEVNLTQEELASKLYVLPSTISKWERGVTYPDITVITTLCKELNISEHEFFTACDDTLQTKEKREIQRYRNITKWSFYILNIGYLIGIITSFICNLAIDHKLTWSLIVLFGIGISFTITSIPVFLKKNKYLCLKTSFLATILVYILLFVINYVNKTNWLLDSFIITTYVFILLWINILICTFTKIDKIYKVSIFLITIALLTLSVNPLCEVIFKTASGENNIYNLITSLVLFIISIFLSLKKFINRN